MGGCGEEEILGVQRNHEHLCACHLLAEGESDDGGGSGGEEGSDVEEVRGHFGEVGTECGEEVSGNGDGGVSESDGVAVTGHSCGLLLRYVRPRACLAQG